MYQALYRKYRPRSFSDVAGQEHVTDTLRRQIINDRLSHAYLFVGTRGTGKTSCAKILSRAVNCLNPIDGNPCNECASCIGIENGSILDVLELDAASNNGVDNIRALRDDAIYTPASVKKRVYILDEVHMLSTSAANALLKILEEPPEHLIFILATTELHKVPATIMSRCQRFSFKRISPDAIRERLRVVAEKEGLSLADDAAEKLTALADGSLRDALSLLDQCAIDTTIDLRRVLDTIGLVGAQEILDLAEAAAAGDVIGALSILDMVYDNGRDMASLLSELATLFRDTLVFKLSPASPLLSGGFSGPELTSLSSKLTQERLISHLEVIREAVFSLSRGASVRLTVEMCLIRICDERLSDDPAAILSRIEILENALSAQDFGVAYTKPQADALGPGVDGCASVSLEQAPPPDKARDTESEDRDSELEVRNARPVDRDVEIEVRVAEIVDRNTEIEDQGAGTVAREAGNSDFWQSILDELKDDISIYSLLSDGGKVRAELLDGVLVISATDSFTANLIESKRFADPLADAARKRLGSMTAIRVKVNAESSVQAGGNKLDSLMENFGGILKREAED